MGATGLAQLCELYWQLREEAGKRQCEIRRGYALQHNVGATGIGASVINILTRNA
jgi:acetyl-CoA acetyltransferase